MKIYYLCFAALLASCSTLNEELEEVTQLSNELEEVVTDYELTLKGYTLEEINKEKDEVTPTTQVETSASPELLKALQESLSKVLLPYDSKMRTDTRADGASAPKVGVFKYATCGNYREFVYLMDCQDGGGTHSEDDIGASTANGNVRYRFCLVDPGNYGGGTLLLYNYVWNPAVEGDVDVVMRNHDDEDSKNKNKIEDNGGLSSTGLSSFNSNTVFYWRFSEQRTTSLGFKYGVIRNRAPHIPETFGPYIHTDDENGSNGNHATVWEHTAYQNGQLRPYTTVRELNGETFRGIETGPNTTYYLTTYE